MLTRLLALVLIMLLLPTVGASDLPESPEQVAGAYALADGTVRLTLTLDDQWSPGDVLPLCPNQNAADNGTTLLGLIQDDCFQTIRSTPSHSLPLPECPPVHVGFIYADPDEACINEYIASLSEWDPSPPPDAPGKIIIILNR